jgi:hypothetical protein
MRRVGLTVATVFLLLSAGGLRPRAAAAQDADDGHPITDATVLAECSSCHTRDEQGRLSRISWLRKTPEGWQTSLVRMTALDFPEIWHDTPGQYIECTCKLTTSISMMANNIMTIKQVKCNTSTYYSCSESYLCIESLGLTYQMGYLVTNIIKTVIIP